LTQQFGKSLRYAGHARQWDNITHYGSVEKQEFLAFYILDDHIAAMTG
jgi:hypothetical protein